MNKAEQLLSNIEELVTSSAPWKDKKQLILDNASDEQKAALSEFISWFEEGELS